MSVGLAPKAESVAAVRRTVVWQDPERMSGAPCFTGTRVPIKALFDYLEAGDGIDTFLDDFPGVSRDQVIGAIHFGKLDMLAE